MSLTLCYAKRYASNPLLKRINRAPLLCTAIESLQEAKDLTASIVLLDETILAQTNLAQWRAQLPTCIFLSEQHLEIDTDLILSDGLPFTQSQKIIQLACEGCLARKRESKLGVSVYIC